MTHNNLISEKNPKIGIKNLGDTSYLNTTLQCFRNIFNIANYFLNPNYSSFNKSFSEEIKNLFHHLYSDKINNDKEAYNPEKVFEILFSIYIIKNYKAYSPNEFLKFLLRKLHEEFNEEEKLNLNKGSNKKKNGDDEELNERDICIINGIKKFKHSIISDNFNIFNIKESHCPNCKNIKYELISFNSYDLDISNCYKKCNNNLTIIKCLENNEKKIEEDCINCKNKCLFKIINRIYDSSNIFVFFLDRKNFDKECIKIPFIIEEKIDLNNYIEKTEISKNYELIGIVSISMREKKYVAFSKSPIDKKWYLYNDCEIQCVIFNFVLESHNRFNFYIPCILFYELNKNN